MDFNKAALEMHETHHGKVGIVKIGRASCRERVFRAV